uniref:Uncharacterized protein n=1 Tax=Rangifer tarandus platyrhynchus TaxID=3082113 RepID=A0ACB0ETG6_RANTA|nr:unnamed protein product [Rangifer tarandus platyrhynchus]
MGESGSQDAVTSGSSGRGRVCTGTGGPGRAAGTMDVQSRARGGERALRGRRTRGPTAEGASGGAGRGARGRGAGGPARVWSARGPPRRGAGRPARPPTPSEAFPPPIGRRRRDGAGPRGPEKM